MQEYRNESIAERLWNIRLFSYQEYLELFHFEPQAGSLLYEKPQGIFRFLMIRNETQHRFFTNQFEANEQDFFRLIASFRNLPLADFFFKPIPLPAKIFEFQRNAYVTGAIGVGKSELLKSLFYQLMKKEQGSLILLDPHGDLANDIMRLQIVKDQANKVLYIDPYLSKNKIPTLNPFQTYDKSEENIDVLTQELVSVFKELLPANLTLQMEAILTPCIATLLRMNNGSLALLQTFMDDNKNEDLYALGLKSPNPSHQEFFKQAFRKSEYKLTKTAIYTRIQSLLNHRIFYQLMNGFNTLNLKEAMDNKKVVIFNLAQGKLGKDISASFGKFVIAQLTGLALRRAHKPKHLRNPTYVFIDEVQNYITSSIEKILSETRKYGLHLIIANQSLAQIEKKKLKDILLSNTNIKIVGSNSPTTLSTFAREMNVKVEVLQQLKKFEFYAQVGNKAPYLMKTTNHLSKRVHQMTDEDRKALRKNIIASSLYREINTQAKPETIHQETGKEKIEVLQKETTEEPQEAETSNRPKPKFSFNKEAPKDDTV